METFDDMVDMEIINDQELLINLNKRYLQKIIFTYVGPTLLVINPFQPCDHLINPSVKEKYIQQAINKEHRGTQPPHMYAIGAEAIKCLFENQKNQAIIISGESGAGKTENAKLCMNLITSVKFDKQQKTSKIAIEDRILSCNPILEAYGNAKTLRNNNSSRFGKYTKIYISKEDKKIKGSQIYNYLLEKSRVCLQGKGERNFHIFYHILKGMPVEELQQYYLTENGKPIDTSKLSYVNTIQHVDGIDDKKLYEEVNQSYGLLGLEEDKFNIHSIVAAVLHLGDLQFDESTLTDDTPCTIIGSQIEVLSKLLQLSVKEIGDSLTLKQRIINKQTIVSPVSYVMCMQNRDSWAKELYERLFNWLVCRLNENILPQNYDITTSTYIGLLDIYGFEVFEKNGFEQVIINYTNERLHQLYIQYVFKGEEVVFREEGLDKFCQQIKYKDNQQLIDCLDKAPQGIFDLLDEVCQVGGDDDLLISKIRKTQKDPKFVLQPKMPSVQSFIIVHTARNVEYMVQGFREKNMDEISVLTALYSQKSGNPLIAKLFTQEQSQKTTFTKKDKSMSKKIRTQMNDLMKELSCNCDAHFVRCIKPNDQKKPQLLEQDYALQQIRYLGVLDSLKVRKQNYPFRRIHRQFYKQFGEMTNNPLFEVLEKQNADFRELNLQLFKQYFSDMGPELVLFGTNRIFIRIEGMDMILKVFQEIMKQKGDVALKIQYKWHKYLINKNLKRIHSHLYKIKLANWSKALAAMQQTYYTQLRLKKMKLYQGQLERILQYIYRLEAMNQFDLILKNINFIQSKVRKWLFMKRIKKLVLVRYNMDLIIDKAWGNVRVHKVLIIQSFFRGSRVRRIHKNVVIKSKQAGLNKRNEIAATKIQKWIKGVFVREAIRKQHRCAYKIQGFIRMIWLTNTFKQIQISTPKIQQLIRRFLIKQRAKHIKSDHYMKPLEQNFMAAVEREKRDKFEFEAQDIEFRGKGYIFDIIVDVEVLVDNECYNPSFTSNYKSLFQQCYENMNMIQSVRVGSNHSMAATHLHKLFTWGLNNEGQLGNDTLSVTPQQPIQLQLNVQIDQIECSDNNGYALSDGRLIIWGDQCKTISYIDIENVRSIACRFDKTYVISNRQVKYWNSDHQIQQISFNQPITQIGLGLEFMAFLSNVGQVFVKGTNEHCQLGFDDRQPRQQVQLVKIPYKINLISCGLKHMALQCCNSKAYVCGWNNHGQLGSGDFEDKPLTLLKQSVQQICCGRTSTLILIDNKQIQWCGSNGFLKQKNEFIPLIKQKLNPVRIQASFSKTLSILSVSYAKLDKDIRKQPEKLRGILSTLTQRWIEYNINSIDPPQIESVSNYLINNHMKKGGSCKYL